MFDTISSNIAVCMQGLMKDFLLGGGSCSEGMSVGGGMRVALKQFFFI